MNVRWVLFDRNAAFVAEDFETLSSLPALGDGKFINGKGYEVFAIVHTPHLSVVEQIFVKEC